ncbi:uncharacterized protein [Amphiura filiformis]|uniref:uncharacterized protein n=1 Tax=Amphiura filiformis TaxID=82378 RepID=UPI003B21CF34
MLSYAEQLKIIRQLGLEQKNCIWNIFLCDGYNDCADGSDEAEPFACNLKPAPAPVGCTETQFDCGNGQCIDPAYVCDKSPDCDNALDESVATCGERQIRCADNEFMCLNGYQCLHSSETCNFVADCDNEVQRTDERNCSCFTYNYANDEVLQTVSCGGYISENETVNWGNEDVSTKAIQCSNERWPADAHDTWHQAFDCTGRLTCEDSETQLLETCTTVLSSCYVNSNGADYKGRVQTTTSGDDCVLWTTDLATNYGYTEERFPLLGAHSYCRNPGGYKTAPWCFIMDSGNFISGVEAPEDIINTPASGDNTGGTENEFTIASITLDEPFNDALTDPTSQAFGNMATQFETEMDNVMAEEFGSDFIRTQVMSFREGSVITEFICFWNVPRDPFTFLERMTEERGFIEHLRLLRGSVSMDNGDNTFMPCSNNELRCRDGECIPMTFVCDGFEDCLGGEDEWPANTHCQDTNGCDPMDPDCQDTNGCDPMDPDCQDTTECDPMDPYCLGKSFVNNILIDSSN